MGASNQYVERFIKEMCLKVQIARSYEELDQLLTTEVDFFGTTNNLSPDEMDQIQNEIYKRLDL